MTLADATVTFNLKDQLGEQFDARRTKIWVSTNVPDETIIDTGSGTIRLGTGSVSIDDLGNVSVTVWVPGADSNPASWQTYIHVDYPDKNIVTGRNTRDFGPFTITADSALADLVQQQEIPPTYLSEVAGALQGFVDDAQAAAAAAEAVGTTNDTVIAAKVVDAASATRAALEAGFARSIVDLRNYVVGIVARVDGVGAPRDPIYIFDVSAVIAAMEARAGWCYVPPGDWRPDAINTALDSAVGGSYNNPKQRFTYVFSGSGKISRLLFPTGMTSTDTLFVANSANTDTFDTHPKVELMDMTVAGADRPTIDATTAAGFILLNQRSITAKRVFFTGCKNPIRVTGYTDHVRLEQVTAQYMHPSSYILDASTSGGGESWVLDGVMPYGTGGCDVNQSRGITVRNGIAGYYRFKNSVVNFEGNHWEGYEMPSYTGGTAVPMITLSGCTAKVESGFYQLHAAFPFISIDDSTTPTATRLHIERGVDFRQRIDTPGSTLGALAGTLVDIVNIGARGEVHVRSVQAALFYETASLGHESPLMYVAPAIRASGNATIDGILTTAIVKQMLAKDAIIKRHQNQWTVRPDHAGVEHFLTLAKITADTHPFMALTAVKAGASLPDYPVEPQMTAGTYYYQARTRDVGGFSSAKVGEASITTTSLNRLVQMVFDAYDSPIVVTIMRGTVANTPTHWAEFIVARDGFTLIDQGTHIGGVAWSTTGLPSGFPAFTESQEGYLLLRNGGAPGVRRIIYGTAPPTVGTFEVGAECKNTAPAAGGTPGWVCVTAGYPGTWKAMASISA